MLLRKMQVPGRFQAHSHLRCQGLSSTNVFIADSQFRRAVCDPDKAQDFPIGANEGNNQELLYVELPQRLQLHAGSFRNVIAPEGLLAQQCFGSNSGGKYSIHRCRRAASRTPSDMELPLLEQSHKRAPKSQELGGPNHEALHKAIEVANGSQL